MDAFLPRKILKICKVAILGRQKPDGPVQIMGSFRSRDSDSQQSAGMDQFNSAERLVCQGFEQLQDLVSSFQQCCCAMNA
jgi:hypothetical protein